MRILTEGKRLEKLFNYLRQGGYVFTRVCLSVCLSLCLSVNGINHKQLIKL